MPRLPLVPADDPGDEIVAAVFEASRAEWRDPIALYRALANSPQMLRPYAGLARALRHDAQTPRALRELMILRVAQLTRSDYEWAHHRSMARDAGVPEAQVAALAHWRDSPLFDAGERAALRCVDEMHELALGDEAFAALEASFGASGAVELILLVSFYEAVARMIQAFDLRVDDAYARFQDRPEII